MVLLSQIKDPIIKKLSVKNKSSHTSNSLSAAFVWSASPEGREFWKKVSDNPSITFNKIKNLLPCGHPYRTVGSYTECKSLYRIAEDGMKFKATHKVRGEFSGVIKISEVGNILLLNNKNVGWYEGKFKGYKYVLNVIKGGETTLKSKGIISIKILSGAQKDVTTSNASTKSKTNYVPIESLKEEKVAPGTKFTAKISGTEVKGKIQLEKGTYYLCQNVMDGSICRDKLGLKYSWYVGKGETSELRHNHVTDLKIDKVEPKPEAIKPEPKIVYKDLNVTFCKGYVTVGDGLKITNEQLEGIAIAQGLFKK